MSASPGVAVDLILNADDYGLHPVVDDSILECFAAGVLTSASLMVNQSGWLQAAERAKAAGLPLGLHFNLTLGRPVSPLRDVPGLVDSHGCFLTRRALLLRLLTGRVGSETIAVELQAQWRRFVNAGLAADHLDSHQHIHAHPRVGAALADLARQQSVPLRFLTPLIRRASSAPLLKRVKQQVVYRQARSQARRWGRYIAHNDFLVSVFDVMNNGVPDAEDYAVIFDALADTGRQGMAECGSRPVVEWMLHPVSDARAVAGRTRIGAVSAAEYRHLLSDIFSQALAQTAVRLIRYQDIVARG